MFEVRKKLLLLLCLPLVFGLSHVSSVFADPPNIIFIMSDDQGVDAIEGPRDGTENEVWSNALDVHTPVLRKLASQGTIFRYARTNSVCSPTRAGIMSGRYAIRTGVTGIPTVGIEHPDRDRLSLQTHETTIGEVLQSAGYYTIHADKWHCGWAENQGPLAQGFDVAFRKYDYLDLDLPDVTGDEHHSLMVDLAVDAYQSAPQGPKALMFWTYVPHKRGRLDKDGLNWWEVDRDLLPHYDEEQYYTGKQTNRNRYRAMIESLDTEIGRMLIELNVINQYGNYIPESNTVVFFMSDNGTPREVALVPDHAKRSLFEGGTRVPLFAFGAGIESGRQRAKLVSHVDLYDTIADIADAPLTVRGELQRDSMSFADDLGYSDELPNRYFSISSQGHTDPMLHNVAITDGNYKLIAPAGSFKFALGHLYQFYDLNEDPEEVNDLLLNMKTITRKQQNAARKLLDELPNYWGTSISNQLRHHVSIPLTDILALTNHNSSWHKGALPLGYNETHIESRIFMRFDIEQLDDLLPIGYTIDDIEAAQVIGFFNSDSQVENETDTGLIHLYPMLTDWYSQTPTWSEIVDDFDNSFEVGSFDVPPHVIPVPGISPNNFVGVPMVNGCPISFTNNRVALPDLIRMWYDNPNTNYGIVLITDPVSNVTGDQRITLRSSAVLRLSLRSE